MTDSNIIALTFTTLDGDLFNETVTDVTETTCTATVDSATDQGTLYMAVRTSGAYGPGDEADIVNAVGAIDNGNKTPVIGTNTFNVTGLSSDIDYHCGFTIETADPATGYELDVTTEGAGVFTVSRATSSVGIDDNGDFVVVPSGKIILTGGSFDGSDFSAPCQGMLFHRATTNTLHWSGGEAFTYRDSWGYDGVTNTDIQKGVGYYCDLGYTTSSPGQDYLAKGNDGASYSGPWVTAVLVMQGTADIFCVELNNGRGSANWQWVGGNLVLESVLDIDTEDTWAFEVVAGVWCVCMLTDWVSNQWKTLHLYPKQRYASSVLGDSVKIFGGHIVDEGVFPGVLIPTVGSTASVDATEPEATLAAMGIPDITGDFTLHMQFEVMDPSVASENQYFFDLYDGTTDNRVRVGRRDGKLRVSMTSAGSSSVGSFNTLADFTPGVLMDLRIVNRTVNDGLSTSMSLWMTAGTGTAGVPQTTTIGKSFAVPLHTARLAALSTNSPPTLLKKFKLYDTALDDTTIEAWT